MLTTQILDQILQRLPGLTVGVVGDLFLDRYLDIDDALTEPSLETGLDAYQVVRVRPSPGAAGTIINNLVAFGVKQVCAVSVIGDDGEGYELRQALASLGRVDTSRVFVGADRRTPTYTKPMLHRAGQPARELNRLDIKNRTRLPFAAEQQVLDALTNLWPRLDALLVLDQVSEAECGVITSLVRDSLGELGRADPDKVLLADSRERIGLFKSLWLKPNRTECLGAVGKNDGDPEGVLPGVEQLAGQVGRPVFCTCGDQGIVVVDPRSGSRPAVRVPSYPVTGPIDIVGAGDSTAAAIACGVAAGADLPEAAAFGNLVASITIQQLGTTGTASPVQIRQRWQQVAEM